MTEIDLLKERNVKVDWFALRNQAAIANGQAILGNNEMIMKLGIRAENDREDIHTTIAKCAIEHADTLINELQKGQFQKQDSKQDWSEEDKKKISRIYSILSEASDEHAFFTTNRILGDKECVELQDWLKSLIPQNRWKPSKEQMTAIQSAIGIVGELTPTALKLKELREQLKKLTE